MYYKIGIYQPRFQVLLVGKCRDFLKTVNFYYSARLRSQILRKFVFKTNVEVEIISQNAVRALLTESIQGTKPRIDSESIVSRGKDLVLDARVVRRWVFW
jgi:hypothetical protein